jgi:hypothetical protein
MAERRLAVNGEVILGWFPLAADKWQYGGCVGPVLDVRPTEIWHAHCRNAPEA